jgi:hypothetical protein
MLQDESLKYMHAQNNNNNEKHVLGKIKKSRADKLSLVNLYMEYRVESA